MTAETEGGGDTSAFLSFGTPQREVGGDGFVVGSDPGNEFQPVDGRFVILFRPVEDDVGVRTFYDEQIIQILY